MRVSINTRELEKKILNIYEYSIGFLDGIDKGKGLFLRNLGVGVIEVLKQYVDAEARSNPKALHHVYEWYQTGSPNSRLYDFDYTVSNLGLSFKSTFRQSTTMSNGSSTPFYDKAKIMEEGIPVTISPKKADKLVFEVEGETIFTSKEVTVQNPGGDYVEGSFEKIADQFFNRYFKQSFLKSSGIYDYIKNPIVYKKNFAAGSKSGRSKGVSTGFKWIANARIGAA
jgi:hypothetical protein